MRAIWKFPLDITETQDVRMPRGAKILSVQMQRGKLVLWAVVDPDKAIQERTFHVFGTGHDFPDWLSVEQHVGTVQDMNGALIWHVFQQRPS